MSTDIKLFISSVEKETNRIWLKEPEDIYAIKNGYIPSEAGIYGQYFTVLVMLSGEVRALGIHIFSDLLKFSQNPEFDLNHLKIMAKQMLKIDVGVVSYFGLTLYGKYLSDFYNLIDSFESKDEFVNATSAMFTYTNRYQMWLHQIFPWKVSTFFKQKTPSDYAEITKKLTEYKNCECIREEVSNAEKI